MIDGLPMISKVLILLRDNLKAYLTPENRQNGPVEDKVVFADTSVEPLSFKSGAISLLLVNIEEEKLPRTSDPYQRTTANGRKLKINPEVKLNLYVLFVSRFPNYEDSLTYLSGVIQFFQQHRVVDHQAFPDLDEGIDHLFIELNTLSFAEQNEVWGSLRTTYYPSVMYKVKMVVFRDDDPLSGPQITERTIQTSS